MPSSSRNAAPLTGGFMVSPWALVVRLLMATTAQRTVPNVGSSVGGRVVAVAVAVGLLLVLLVVGCIWFGGRGTQ